MKKLTITSLLFLASVGMATTVHAAEKIDFSCVTGIPTTSFVVREAADKVAIEIIHHNGTAYMPIFEGIATPSDLSVLSERAELLSSLGDYLRFEWPRSQCKKDDDGDLIAECLGSVETQEISGHKVLAWMFDSALVMEKSFLGKFNSYKLTLNIDVDGKSYYIPMKYDVSECSASAGRVAMPVRRMKN